MKALVIGASGGFGGAVAAELMRRGFETTALVRQGGRDPAIPGIWQVPGDALDPGAVGQAARGMDLIVFGFNVPYDQWEARALRAVQIAADAAVAEGATLLFPGNVYGLGPDFSRPLAEDAPREAPTRLGQLRNEMEAALRRASMRGARVIVLRAGDYFGANADNTWFAEMTRKALAGGAITDPGTPDVPHCWAYLPDVARAAVDLVERRHTLQPYEELHFEGHAATSAQLVRAIRRALGDPERKVRRLPWWGLRLLSPFWPMAGHLLRMRYLWEEPVLLDGSRLQGILGRRSWTPLEEAVRQAIGATTERQRLAA
jgi:nucleoside-diphosphate-sugar epimerase